VNEEKFYIVNGKILPDIFIKVMKVKELIYSEQVKDITEGVKKVGISRSAYYKYRDAIYPMNEPINSRKVILNILLSHEAGALSRVLDLIAEYKGNILTINQDIPINLTANVTITVDVSNITIKAKTLLENIDALPNVVKTRVLFVE
jgi:chorismate mutase